MKAQRWRITFAKKDAMRYTGHLDLILTWERTFRRSGLPLSYSEGFSPRPVINLAAPLPLGYTSNGEIGDFWLSKETPEEIFKRSLIDVLPPGLAILHVTQIDQIHGNKLPSLVTSASYSISLGSVIPDLSDRITQVLNKAQIITSRKDKSYDLRPLIHEIVTIPGENTILTKLSLLPGATGRPDELLKVLKVPVHEARICRERLFLYGHQDSK